MKPANLASLGLVAILTLSLPNASAQTPLATGRAALAQQTPAALENAHTAFKSGLETAPNDPELNFFYAATLLAREAHTDSFKQQFTSLNATIINPSLYELEYSFPLGFADMFMPAAGATTDAHLAYLNSKAALLDQAIASLDKMTNENFVITLTSAETSLLDTKVDYGDICLLRAGLRLARAGLYLANSYNISGEYRKFYDLYAAGNLTPQAFLATFPQLFNLSTTTSQRVDARTQIQLAHAEWNKALAAIKTKRPVSEGTVLGPNAENDSTPFLFAFENIDDAEVVDAQFDALVLSLSSQQILPANASDDFYLEGYKINLSPLVTSSASLRSLAPTRFDRGFFRPSSWPDATLGGIFPDATQDDMNDAGNFLFVLQPTVYEPYQFWLLAGNPEEPGYFEEGEVRFNQISGIAVDSKGNIYVADSGNHVIRKISIDNKVTTIAGQKWSNWQERRELERKYAGNPQRYPGILFVDGPIAVDGNGTVYFENGNSISKISENGILSHFAGSFSWDSPRDGFGSEAAFAGISAMTVDKNGNLLVCDGGAIRKITPAGHVTTIAGILGWEEGYVEGNGSLARFSDLTGIAVDEAGVIYVMDSNNYVIRKIQPNGFTSTFVGNAIISNHFDAKGTKARLNRPEGLAIDSSGNLYFADASTIRKVKPDGTITSIAGKVGKAGSRATISGQMGILERAGEAAVFGEDDEVTGLAVDRRGTLYASFEDCIYEAESIAVLPTGTPFPIPTPLPTPAPQPTPLPSPAPTPQLLSLSLSTTSVDLTSGAVEFAIIPKISSQLFNLSLSFRNISEQFNMYGQGWTFSGAIQPYTVRWDDDTKPGLWSLIGLEYSTSESGEGKIEYNEEQIINRFGNISIDIINPIIANDLTAPALIDLKLLSSEVNASQSSVKIRYRAQIEDDLSGFDWMSMTFRNPSSSEAVYTNLGSWNSLVAVNGKIKTYEGSIEIPQGSAEGEWILESIYLIDEAANGGSLTLTPELQSVKFIVSSTAVNTPESQNLYAPWPVALLINPTSVDVSSADQKVKVQLVLNNDDLPTRYWISVSLDIDNGLGGGYSVSWSDFKLVSGSVTNGIYEGEVIIPRFSKNGNYSITSIYIDENNQSGENKSFNRWGDSIPSELRKTITVTGTQDVTAPLLQSIEVSPSLADTRNGPVSVTANITITDDLIGLEDKDEWTPAGQLLLRSPSGNEFAWSKLNWSNRISGNSLNGTYQVQFDLPQYSEEGAWTIDYIELIDRNYNTRFLIPANLTAQQIAASTIQVQGWPRGWETVSSDDRDAATSAKAIVTKQSAKFWLPVENIDRNWTWGTGSDNSLEYEWAVEFYGNSDYAFSFTKWKSGDEGATSGNFTQFLDAGQVNVWEEHDDSGSVVAGASITASRDGQRLLLELTDPMILSEIQAEMPGYLSIRSLDPLGNSYNRKVKVEYVKEDVQLDLGNLTHTYDGAEKTASVNTSPGNLTQAVTLTYDGVTTPPTAPGNYTVVAFMNDPNYSGRQVGTMAIAKKSQTIGALSAIGEKVYGSAPFAVTVPTASSGLPVTLSVKSGPATISANTVTLTSSGTVVLAANQSGNETYNVATEVTTSFNVSNPPPPPPAPSTGGGGGGGGGEPEKSKKGKKSQHKNDVGDKKSSAKKSDKKDNDQKDSKRKDSDQKDSKKKSPGKKSSGGDSQKSSGGKRKSKK